MDKLRGKVVLVFFFATWSGPSMVELDWVKQLAAQFSPESMHVLGISLDNDPVPVPAKLSDHGVTWPVFCDGRGWQGDLVRSLGINALPTLWIIDKKGILRVLDAKQDAAAVIQRAVEEAAE